MGILSEGSKTAKVAALAHSDFYTLAVGLRSTLILYPVRVIANRAGNRMFTADLTGSSKYKREGALGNINQVVIMSRNVAALRES